MAHSMHCAAHASCVADAERGSSDVGARKRRTDSVVVAARAWKANAEPSLKRISASFPLVALAAATMFDVLRRRAPRVVAIGERSGGEHRCVVWRNAKDGLLRSRV